MGGGGHTPIGGGGNNAAGAAAGGSLSPSDSAKLKELLKEQATLQAAQKLGQYQTLAQQIAEIASAKGEDYMRVLEEMGIQSKDLEKGLGIKSDADLKAYLDKVQKQTDSAGQNTTSIVNAINALPSAIANAIAGKPTPVGGVHCLIMRRRRQRQAEAAAAQAARGAPSVLMVDILRGASARKSSAQQLRPHSPRWCNSSPVRSRAAVASRCASKKGKFGSWQTSAAILRCR
jgi:hypothetical protein